MGRPGTQADSQQIKMYGFVKRDGSCDHETFCNFWKNPHIPNVIKYLQPRRYYVGFFNEPKNGRMDFDGYAQLWFNDVADFKARSKARDDNPEAMAARTQDPLVVTSSGPGIMASAGE